jgi:ribosomal-protein-alanine N-acetyltransferase
MTTPPPQFDFETFPILETPRLLLREIVRADASAILRIRGDAEVTRYNTGDPYESLEDAIALIDDMALLYRQKRELRWGITLKGVEGLTHGVIGMCGYNYWVAADHRASIGYDLARAFWRDGIMTEALRAVLGFGFAQMSLNRIEADVAVENTASIKLLRKLGFRKEGLQREQFFEDGLYHDLMLFGLLRREYTG